MTTMHNKNTHRWLVWTLCLVTGTAFAGIKEDAFLDARDAFRAGQAERFERAAAVVGQGHPMSPYLDAWRFKLRQFGNKAPWSDAEVATVLQNLPARALPTEQLRREYLTQLVKRNEWVLTREQYSLLVNKDDAGMKCVGIVLDALGGQDITLSMRSVLQNPKELPDACVAAGDYLFQTGKLSPRDLWDRMRLLVENNYLGSARRVYGYLIDNGQAPSGSDLKLFDAAVERSSQFLAGSSGPLSPARQEMVGVALSQIARSDPDEAMRWLGGRLEKRLEGNPRAWAHSQVALAAARKWNPAAAALFDESSADTRSAEANEWMVRSLLLSKNWPGVQKAIEAMPLAQRNEPVWTYWLARAKLAAGDAVNAKKLLQQIAGPFGFYNKLAQEELGQAITLPPLPAPLTEVELNTAKSNPGLQRASIWYSLGQRTEGFAEFNFTLVGMNDRQLLAASEWAKQEQLLDRAIAAADKTQQEHDVRLRFLTPYRDLMRTQAQNQGIEESWAYGLIRQESRFVTVARSTVGASGLMQIMPATAKLVAKKIGLGGFESGQVNDIQTNLLLGTSYLRMMLEQLDYSPLLASAGYNAGPGRPRNWLSRLPAGYKLEGAIFAEAIPFNETRDYVKKVLSNTTLYAALLEGKPQSLKSRLGNVTGTGGVGAPLNNE